MNEPVAVTKNGSLRGRIRTDIRGGRFFSFQGIPYAMPPVGSLRFKAPEPAESWTGLRDATAEGESCFYKDSYVQDYVGQEDCLFLNVYTPNLGKTAGLKPVMFWIHGGGYSTGSSSDKIYGPEFLVAEDVVLVTINYRLGVFGFLSLEDPSLDVPGNAALKDLVLGLRWVRSNIEAFGGDATNVTIFGQSAGATSVHYLILSPSAKGLFHKAILQSGTALNGWARGRKCAGEIVEKLGANAKSEREILAVLQNTPTLELYDALHSYYKRFLVCEQRPYGPVVEKPNRTAFLTEEPIDIMRSGKYNHVPIIIGFNTREGMLAEAYHVNIPIPLTDFETAIPYSWKIEPGSDLSKLVARKIKQFYYGSEEPTRKNIDTFYVLESDNFFIREILKTAKIHAENNSCPVFLYRMSIESSLNVFKMFMDIKLPGVSHADELGYLFKTGFTPDELDPDSIEDIGVKRFTKLWTNFAKQGDPNPSQKDPLIDVVWKPLTAEERFPFLDIGEKLTIGHDPEKKRAAFWDDLETMVQDVGRKHKSKL